MAEAIGDRLAAAGLPRRAIRQIRNAVAPPPTHPRAEARERLGLPKDAPVGICAARLVAQKRHDVLLEAWREVRSDAVLLIAGDGALRPEIEKAAADAAFSGRVRVLGIRDDVDWLLAASDVFVLASDWEGMPLAVLEALALGLPVVATDVDGLRQACGDQATLVPPQDPIALAKALNAVFDGVSDNSQRESSRNGLPHTAGVDMMTESYRALFAELISGSSVRTAATATTTTSTGTTDKGSSEGQENP